MIMNKELPALVLESVGSRLKSLGFRLVKNKKWFVRTVDSRTQNYQLVALDGNSGYRICPSVSVRFEEVERIFHKTSGFEPEYQKDTPTVGIDLWSVYGKDGYQMPLKQEADLETVASRVLTIFQEKAQPYFSQFSTLAAVDSAINDQPRERCIHGGLPWRRCSTGLIVAKLTGRQNYNELVSIYCEIVRKDAGGYYLPRFEALLSNLGTLPDRNSLPPAS
jgi:hypothetical protein